MVADWSRYECDACVEEYITMLAAETRDESYNKAEHCRRIEPLLNQRTKGSIEYKFQNISAILIRHGHIYIRGYKPAWNYQALLEHVVVNRLSSNSGKIAQCENRVAMRKPQKPLELDPNRIIVSPPRKSPPRAVNESDLRMPSILDFANREAMNRELGEHGEAFVLALEKSRLALLGRSDLLPNVEWTSKEKGDGTGYDIRSFEGSTDEEVFIEVKTTNSGMYQPFLISSNELSFSESHANRFALYRVFDFARKPAVFILNGQVSRHVTLVGTQFRASF